MWLQLFAGVRTVFAVFARYSRSIRAGTTNLRLTFGGTTNTFGGTTNLRTILAGTTNLRLTFGVGPLIWVSLSGDH